MKTVTGQAAGNAIRIINVKRAPRMRKKTQTICALQVLR